MSFPCDETAISLSERIARHSRRVKTPQFLLNYTLDAIIETCSAEGGIFFLYDNFGVDPALVKTGKKLELSSEFVLFCSKGLPPDYKSPNQIFVRKSDVVDKHTLSALIQEKLADIPKLFGCGAHVMFMANKKELLGAIYVFYRNQDSFSKALEEKIEEALSEVTMMLEIISDWQLHQKLVDFNQFSLALQKNYSPSFIDKILEKARQLMNCVGLSLFIKEPTIDGAKFFLVGTYPRKKPRDRVSYDLKTENFTSKVLKLKQSCTIHFSNFQRVQMDLPTSKWEDTDTAPLSAMVIPILHNAELLGLLRCTNNFTLKDHTFFTFIDVHFAEAFSYLMYTWVMAARKEELYSAALLNISHDTKLIAAGIKSAARYIFNELKRPRYSEEEKIFKLNHIRDSANTLLELLPALVRSQGIDSSSDQQSEVGFLLYADLCKPVCEYYRDETNQRKIDILITGYDQFGRIFASFEDFKLMFQNLISNAVKYTFDGNNISVIFQKSPGDEYDMIHVMSQSIPIEINEYEEIFRSNYRSINVRKTNIKGEGRGLMIARTIARRLRGDIVFNSSEGYNIFTILIHKSLFDSQMGAGN